MKLVLICVFSIWSAAFAQEGKRLMEFSEVVQVDSSLKKAQLFSAARDWIVKSFQSGKAVIQVDDKDEGKLSFRGNSTVNVKGNFYTGTAGAGAKACWFTVMLEFKDAKWRYNISNIGYREDPLTIDPPTGFGHKAQLPYRDACIQEMKTLIQQLKAELLNGRKTDW